MIIIGLVLLIAGAGFGLDLVWKNSYTIKSPHVFGQSIALHHASVLFVAGAITGAAILLGIALLMAGMRRKGTKAKQHRQDRKEAKNAARERDRAQKENDKLRQRLDSDDDADARTGGATAAD
jgi:hypothetical protein